MIRRRQHEKYENRDRWLVSYADFITLLFAFFVVMYSISSVNEGKYRVLSSTLESVFSDPKRKVKPVQTDETVESTDAQDSGGDFLVESPKPGKLPPLTEGENVSTINEISKQLNSALHDLIENEDVLLKHGDDWLELEIRSEVLFRSGEAKLESSAIPMVGEIAAILNTSANPVQVEGFTDNNPINTSRFPSNWELSAARAASVVHLLERYGLAPGRMSAIGYGEYKPIADNSTEQGRQKNRRVVLVILGSQHSRRDLSTFKIKQAVQDGST